MNTNDSLYSDRKDISRPTACETCSDGIATGNNVHCHRCLDEFWGKSKEEIFCEEYCDAARIRIMRWHDADEAIRLSGGERSPEHRFEGIIIRRLQDILESGFDIVEKMRLAQDVEHAAQDIEFEYSYNLTRHALHAAHVRFGRLLKDDLPPRRAKRQEVSPRVGFSQRYI